MGIYGEQLLPRFQDGVWAVRRPGRCALGSVRAFKGRLSRSGSARD